MSELRHIVEHAIQCAFQDGVGVALGKPNFINRNGALTEHIMNAIGKSQESVKPVANQDLFYSLCSKLGQGKQVKYTPARAKKLQQRLKTFSADELLQIASAIADNEYMMGVNDGGRKYGTIDYLLRNDEKADEWLNQSSSNQKIDLSKVQF